MTIQRYFCEIFVTKGMIPYRSLLTNDYSLLTDQHPLITDHWLLITVLRFVRQEIPRSCKYSNTAVIQSTDFAGSPYNAGWDQESESIREGNLRQPRGKP